MPIQTEEELDTLIKYSLASEEERKTKELFVGPPLSADSYYGPGDRPYRKNGPWEQRTHPDSTEAKVLYFYYLRFEDGAGIVGDFVTIDISGFGNDLSLIDQEIVKEIDSRKGVLQGVTPKLDGQKCDQHSFVAVYLANPDWELIDIAQPGQPEFASWSLHFFELNGKRKGLKNGTFFNAQNRPITTSSAGNVKYLLCENLHLDSRNGKPRKKNSNGDSPPEDPYKFDVYYKVPVVGSSNGEKLIMIVDPGVRNLGP